MAFDREQMKEKVEALAASGVYIGTSSWKYQGWLGQLYTASKYLKETKSTKEPGGQGFFSGLEIAPPPLTPEKIDDKKFERDCLAEYAEVFKTVSVDAAFYKFPDEKSLGKLVA